MKHGITLLHANHCTGDIIEVNLKLHHAVDGSNISDGLGLPGYWFTTTLQDNRNNRYCQ
ncbi:hypothetical protein NC796_18105 [Aliifodinibius sp. S!AR15-10]|uniref:hypothetical protein n=1 Tax=Aliifodinibius sp. S!AR15-10 TaxID=2950437 RepID=UPI00285B7CD9|nr:hypothetical protein [Aliifodinibius sp. S!AR15-10]MDR8393076.1 hypothetical protein [Aliifodinibius sp. S!AR15-10]